MLEHHGANLPAWLAPEQVSIVPVTGAQAARAAELRDQLAAAGLRARVDAGEATLSRRIAEAHHDGVPFVVVIGDRELRDTSLSIRARDGRWTAPAADAIAELSRRCAPAA